MKPTHTLTESTPSEAIRQAIALLTGAGYRVSKPRKRKKESKVGPTFVARFVDGEVVRMTTFTKLDNLDWSRGLKLAQAAHQTRQRCRQIEHQRYRSLHTETERDHEQRLANCIDRLDMPSVPPLEAAHFEQDGVVLARYGG